MEPLTAGLITGGGSLLSSVFTGLTSAGNTQAQIQAQEGMQLQSQQYNAQQAQLNRDFQQQMSSTAYQRSTADMEKAGLNPAMMFGSGGAASVPGGSAASVGTPSVPTPQKVSPFAGIGDAMSKAVGTAIQAKTFEQMTQQIANMRAEEGLTKAREVSERVEPAVRAAQTGKLTAETRREIERLPSATLEGTSAKDVLDNVPAWLRSSLNVGSWGAGKVSDIANPIVSSARNIVGLDILKKAFQEKNSATSMRRGMDMERTFGRNNREE